METEHAASAPFGDGDGHAKDGGYDGRYDKDGDRDGYGDGGYDGLFTAEYADVVQALHDGAAPGRSLSERGLLRYRVLANPCGTPIDETRLAPSLLWLLSRPQVFPTLADGATPNAAWHAFRLDHLSAASVGSVLEFEPGRSHNPHRTRRQLFLEKTNQAPPEPGNAHMARGCELEPHALARYAALSGETCLGVGAVEHPLHPYLSATLDAATLRAALVECKCPGRRSVRRAFTHADLRAELPYIDDQIQLQAAVSGLGEARLLQYVPPEPEDRAARPHDGRRARPRLWEIVEVTAVDVDPRWLPSVEPALRAFWDEVLLYRAENPRWRERRWDDDPALLPLPLPPSPPLRPRRCPFRSVPYDRQSRATPPAGAGTTTSTTTPAPAPAPAPAPTTMSTPAATPTRAAVDAKRHVRPRCPFTSTRR